MRARIHHGHPFLKTTHRVARDKEQTVLDHHRGGHSRARRQTVVSMTTTSLGRVLVNGYVQTPEVVVTQQEAPMLQRDQFERRARFGPARLAREAR